MLKKKAETLAGKISRNKSRKMWFFIWLFVWLFVWLFCATCCVIFCDFFVTFLCDFLMNFCVTFCVTYSWSFSMCNNFSTAWTNHAKNIICFRTRSVRSVQICSQNMFLQKCCLFQYIWTPHSPLLERLFYYDNHPLVDFKKQLCSGEFWNFV